MRLMWGTVVEVIEQRAGCDELSVELDGRAGSSRAILYPELTGKASEGERVLLNTTALDLELGTGGKHFVVARAGENSPEGISFEERMDPDEGHLMKLRYSPLQLNVLSVEAQESPYHKVMEYRESLEGIPVVCCGLHSQVPLVAATVKKLIPHAIVGYVMDDAGALALSLSSVLAQAVDKGLIDVTVSTGQSFGGQIEAINLHSGLLAAAHVGACDVIITAIGPGLAGTGTPFGHGGVAQGEQINAVAVLGGRAVVCLRMSQADKRERHLGISHHTITALSRIALAPATIAVPALPEDSAVREKVEEQLDALPNFVGHGAFQLEEPVFDKAALRGIEVKTMGRGPDEDPLFFEAAAAAGATAAAFAVREDPRDETDEGAGATAPGCASKCATKFDIMDLLEEE